MNNNNKIFAVILPKVKLSRADLYTPVVLNPKYPPVLQATFLLDKNNSEHIECVKNIKKIIYNLSKEINVKMYDSIDEVDYLEQGLRAGGDMKVFESFESYDKRKKPDASSTWLSNCDYVTFKKNPKGKPIVLEDQNGKPVNDEINYITSGDTVIAKCFFYIPTTSEAKNISCAVNYIRLWEKKKAGITSEDRDYINSFYKDDVTMCGGSDHNSDDIEMDEIPF